MLLLSDVLIEDFRDLAGTLLRVSLLASFVVDVGDTESRRVALGPLEITAKHLCQSSYLSPRTAVRV